MNRDYFSTLDHVDEFASYRKSFMLDDITSYLCGHSLGPMPRLMPDLLQNFLENEWGVEKVRGWNTCQWLSLPQQVGEILAPLIGVTESEVIVADSTSINLFKLLAAACETQKDRPIILTEADNFPADLYIADGLCRLLPNQQLMICERQELLEKLNTYGPKIAVVMLTHCNYGNSELFDMGAITLLAHQHGALVLFDLSHSAGIMRLNLAADEVDLAIGCSYKYLNGGPGAPAFLYVTKHLQTKLQTPLQGWLGHAAPFNFDATYTPAKGMQRFICGTPPIISLIALKHSLLLANDMSMEKVRKKSLRLSSSFIELMDNYCPAMQLASPRMAQHRGAHVTYCHQDAYAISRALLDHNIVVDYRAPNKIRFSFPAYVRYIDVFDTVSMCSHLIQHEIYKKPQYYKKMMVT